MNKQLLYKLILETWSTYINIDLKPVNHSVDWQSCEFGCFIEIPIVGKQKFLLVLAASEKLAFVIASQFFQLAVDELTTQDATDSLGELANMLAGKVQQHLSEETQLELPIKVEKENAFKIMESIGPNWEAYARQDELILYVGVHGPSDED